MRTQTRRHQAPACQGRRDQGEIARHGAKCSTDFTEIWPTWASLNCENWTENVNWKFINNADNSTLTTFYFLGKRSGKWIALRQCCFSQSLCFGLQSVSLIVTESLFSPCFLWWLKLEWWVLDQTYHYQEQGCTTTMQCNVTLHCTYTA